MATEYQRVHQIKIDQAYYLDLQMALPEAERLYANAKDAELHGTEIIIERRMQVEWIKREMQKLRGAALERIQTLRGIEVA